MALDVFLGIDRNLDIINKLCIYNTSFNQEKYYIYTTYTLII